MKYIPTVENRTIDDANVVKHLGTYDPETNILVIEHPIVCAARETLRPLGHCRYSTYATQLGIGDKFVVPAGIVSPLKVTVGYGLIMEDYRKYADDNS